MDAITLINAVINGIVIGTLLALPALAITMVFGIARFPNAAAGDYMTLGAYCAVGAQAFISDSLIASVALAAVVTAAVSVFFYGWVFRPLARGQTFPADRVDWGGLCSTKHHHVLYWPGSIQPQHASRTRMEL